MISLIAAVWTAFLPQDTAYDGQSRAFLQDGIALASERSDCSDELLLKSSEYKSVVVRYCGDGWGVEEQGSEILHSASSSRIEGVSFFSMDNDRLIVHVPQSVPPLFILKKGKSRGYSEVAFSRDSFIIASGGNDYLLIPGTEDTEVQKLQWSHGTRPSMIPLLQTFWREDDGRVLLGKLRSGDYVLYHTESDDWLLPVPEEINDKEKKIFSSANVLLRLTLPPRDRRSYFEIYVDGESVGRSSIVQDGVELLSGLRISPGKHVIKLVHFFADTSAGDEEYRRSNNVHQPPIFQVEVQDKKHYMVILQSADGGSQSFQMEYREVTP